MTSLAKPLLPFLAALNSAIASALAGDPIQSVPLDDSVVVQVGVATNHVTTLSFPGPITAIDGANVSADPKLPGLFQLAHTKGSDFLSVRALEPKATANLNVRWKNQTYVFLLREDPEPVLSLKLVVSVAPVALPAPRLSTTRLLSLLDKAKAFPLLKQQHPQAVAGVDVRTFVGNTNATDYGDFEIRIDEVYRFAQEDSLVFRITLRNRAETELQIDPGTLSVRAGNRVYPQAITDAPDAIPPKAEVVAYLAITGSPDGGRNELSLKNAFRILVARTSPAPAQP